MTISHYPVKVVITGGPCAGKSSVIAALLSTFRESICSVPEVATLLLSGGFTPPPKDTQARGQWLLEFQLAVANTQIALENIALLYAKSDNRRLVVYDRGLCDGVAYHPDGEQGFLSQTGVDRDNLYARYDHVIFLDSLAISKPEFFGNIGNTHRYENLYEAQQLNQRLAEAWQDHPGFCRLTDSYGLGEKIAQVNQLIESWL